MSYPHARQISVILAVGLSAAAIELVPILLIQSLLGTSPLIVFQSIAMSVLGREAFTGGLASAALGCAIHIAVSIVAAGVYVLASEKLPIAAAKPIVSGLVYGVLAYLVMNFIAVPLTRIGFRLPPSFGTWAMSFAVHLLAFGLPIALMTRFLSWRSPTV